MSCNACNREVFEEPRQPTKVPSVVGGQVVIFKGKVPMAKNYIPSEEEGMLEAQFPLCQMRRTIPRLKKDGTYDIIDRCMGGKSPFYNREIDPPDCLNCPLLEIFKNVSEPD